MKFKEEISIWFFIGVALLVNGVLILGAGLYEWLVAPPVTPVVLYEIHANVWWGAFILIVGAVYCWQFRPKQGEGTTESVATEAIHEESHAK